jgi:hypothetical protein
MNLHGHTICDDWGWYIDTDSNSFISSTKIKNYKKINNYKLNKLYPINEVVEEYDKNYLEIAESQVECSRSIIEKTKNNNYGLSLYKIGANTLLSGLFASLLTYIVIFLV